MPVVYLGLGTNLGDREANLRQALARISRTLRIDALSSVYRSEPVGYRDQPEFWNIVLRARTELEASALLDELKGIETDMGRKPSFPNAPRVIDIDLLLYGRERIRTPQLEVPHPRLSERAFVLIPLLELDPMLRHPATGRPLRERLAGAPLERTERVLPGEALAQGKETDADGA
jgi:2-amino-4-hydroxy-6-hydroxymethyldihydropteridine diphosphokinase